MVSLLAPGSSSPFSSQSTLTSEYSRFVPGYSYGIASDLHGVPLLSPFGHQQNYDLKDQLKLIIDNIIS